MNATATRSPQWILDVPPPAVSEDQWRAWASVRPELSAFASMDDLLACYNQGSSLEQNRIFGIFLFLGAVSGGDDVHAAEWAAWMLRPGVLSLLRSLRNMAELPDLQQIVAGALWMQVRDWNCAAHKGTAGAFMRRLRTQVLRELERSLQDHAYPPALRLVGDYEAVSPYIHPIWRNEEHLDPAEVVASLLDWAIEERVISESDRTIMQAVLRAIKTIPATQCRSRSAGLCSMQVSIAAGASIGLAGSTVRRETRRTLDRLVAAAPQFLLSA